MQSLKQIILSNRYFEKKTIHFHSKINTALFLSDSRPFSANEKLITCLQNFAQQNDQRRAYAANKCEKHPQDPPRCNTLRVPGCPPPRKYNRCERGQCQSTGTRIPPPSKSFFECTRNPEPIIRKKETFDVHGAIIIRQFPIRVADR